MTSQSCNIICLKMTLVIFCAKDVFATAFSIYCRTKVIVLKVIYNPYKKENALLSDFLKQQVGD